MKTRKEAFTLVELLVVITIIGMLIALLLPAVNNARAAAKQTQCTNNLRNYAQAMQLYLTSKEYFPGYRQALQLQNGNNVLVSWRIAIQPQMGKEDVIRGIKDGVLGATLPYVEHAICPSDNSIAGKSGPWTSYVANTGRLDKFVNNTGICVADFTPNTLESAANGVFQDKAVPGVGVNVGLSDLKDGASTTLLLSENLDVGYYNQIPITPPILGPNPATWPAQLAAGLVAPECTERGAGFVWWDWSTNYNGTPPAPAPTSGAPQYPVAKINGLKGDYDPTRAGWPSSPSDTTAPSTAGNTNYAARPSSSHSGGVVVAFAAANTRFLSEDMDYRIYCQLMTPNGAKSPTKSRTSTGISWQQYVPLDEGSL